MSCKKARKGTIMRMKTKKLIFFAIILTFFIFLMSCGENAVQNPDGKLDVTTVENIDEYVIIRGNDSSEEISSAVSLLVKEIKTLTGSMPSVRADLKGEKKILVGNTDSKKSKKASEGLGYFEFTIRAEGDDIIICGGSDEATLDAVGFYIENFINKDKKEMYLPIWEEGYTFTSSHKLETLMIDSFDGEITLYNPNSLEIAEDFSERLSREYVGKRINVISGNIPEGEGGIVIKNDLLTTTDYGVRIEDGVIYIEGSYRTYENAVNEFFSLLDKKRGRVTLSETDSVSGKIEALEIPYKNKSELMTVLEYVYDLEDQVIFGQHVAGRPTVGGILEEYYEAVGEYPGAIDFDMLDLPYKDDAYISQVLCELYEFASKGGIITTMYHWANPADEGEYTSRHYRGVLGSKEKWNEVLTPGTELNRRWMVELDTGAKLLKALKEAGVSVLFRPMHEANGGFFWFCAPQGEGYTVSQEDMLRMWTYVHDYYTKDLGLDNILWVYGPNVAGSDNTLPVDYYYPGEEYCDLVSLDWYTSGHYEIAKSYEDILKLDRVTSLAELGLAEILRRETLEEQMKIFTCEDYLKIINDMFKDGYKICYIQVYAGWSGAPAYLGRGELLGNSEMIINLPEMQDVINKALGK